MGPGGSLGPPLMWQQLDMLLPGGSSQRIFVGVLLAGPWAQLYTRVLVFNSFQADKPPLGSTSERMHRSLQSEPFHGPFLWLQALLLTSFQQQASKAESQVKGTKYFGNAKC